MFKIIIQSLNFSNVDYFFRYRFKFPPRVHVLLFQTEKAFLFRIKFFKRKCELLFCLILAPALKIQQTFDSSHISLSEVISAIHRGLEGLAQTLPSRLFLASGKP